MTTTTTNAQLQLLKDESPTLEALLRLNTDQGTDVKTIVMQELEHLNQAALQNKAILECIPETIVYSVKSVLKQNLSLDPAEGLVYIKTRSIKMGVDGQGKDIWKKGLEITPSANGLISIARQCGSILDMKNPKVEKNETGKVIGVSVEILLPSTPEPRWEKREFDESDFERWARASHKENSKFKKDASTETLNYANPNYTSWKGGIDPEFARAKAVRHGLKKLGTNQNEKRVTRITIPATKITVDVEKDMEAEEQLQDTYAEVMESTLNTENVQMPNAEKL